MKYKLLTSTRSIIKRKNCHAVVGQQPLDSVALLVDDGDGFTQLAKPRIFSFTTTSSSSSSSSRCCVVARGTGSQTNKPLRAHASSGAALTRR